MNRLTAYISSQFRNPKGLGGVLISLVQNVVNRAMYREVAGLYSLKPDSKLLDIGCGNGHLLKMLGRRFGCELYGIDISSDAIAMTARRNRRALRENRLHLTVGDCCSLPYAGDLFDAVTSINTVYFWPDPVKGLREIRRTLKTGCAFCNVVYTKAYLDTVRYTQTGYLKYETEDLLRFGSEAGYSRVEKREIVPGKSLAILYFK